MSFELPPKDKLCRFSGFEKSCRELVSSGKCTDAWHHLQGRHPNTGEDMNRWGCCYDFTFLFAMEAARKGHHATASVLTLRNMIFDPNVREKELQKSRDLKTIEAPDHE